MLGIDQLKVVAYWPGSAAENDTGETVCRSCGEKRGLPAGDAVTLYAATGEAWDRLEDSDLSYELCCEDCGAVIVKVEEWPPKKETD